MELNAVVVGFSVVRRQGIVKKRQDARSEREAYEQG